MIRTNMTAGAMAVLCGALLSAQSARSQSATVTGCLEKGAKAGQFTITDGAEPGGANTGVTPSSNAGTIRSMYRLTGGDLSAHVGHKVEVTGTIVPNAKHKSQGAKDGVEGTLTVTNVKMISTNCP
jgi:hypothetical protein